MHISLGLETCLYNTRLSRVPYTQIHTFITKTGKVDIYYSNEKWKPPKLAHSLDGGKTWEPPMELTPSQKSGYAPPLWWCVTVRVPEFVFYLTDGADEVCVCFIMISLSRQMGAFCFALSVCVVFVRASCNSPFLAWAVCGGASPCACRSLSSTSPTARMRYCVIFFIRGSARF